MALRYRWPLVSCILHAATAPNHHHKSQQSPFPKKIIPTNELEPSYHKAPGTSYAQVKHYTYVVAETLCNVVHVSSREVQGPYLKTSPLTNYQYPTPSTGALSWAEASANLPTSLLSISNGQASDIQLQNVLDLYSVTTAKYPATRSFQHPGQDLHHAAACSPCLACKRHSEGPTPPHERHMHRPQDRSVAPTNAGTNISTSTHTNMDASATTPAQQSLFDRGLNGSCHLQCHAREEKESTRCRGTTSGCSDVACAVRRQLPLNPSIAQELKKCSKSAVPGSNLRANSTQVSGRGLNCHKCR
jgi:hypothetical protein